MIDAQFLGEVINDGLDLTKRKGLEFVKISNAVRSHSSNSSSRSKGYNRNIRVIVLW